MNHQELSEASQSRADIIVRQSSAEKVVVLENDADQSVVEAAEWWEGGYGVLANGLHKLDY